MRASSIARGEFEQSDRNMFVLGKALEVNVNSLTEVDLQQERAIYQRLLREGPQTSGRQVRVAVMAAGSLRRGDTSGGAPVVAFA